MDPMPAIRQAILDGCFFPNERLVESDLMGRFGGTRAAIRQALAVLEQQGLVVRERNRGARVRLVTETEAIQITQVRAVLEALLAREAARNAGPDDIARLQEIMARLEALSSAHDLVGYSEANLILHAEIARIARHPPAGTILNGIHAQTVVFQYRAIFAPGRAAAVDAEHRAVVSAIAARDPDAAEAAMRSHVENVGWALKAAIAGRRMAPRLRA